MSVYQIILQGKKKSFKLRLCKVCIAHTLQVTIKYAILLIVNSKKSIDSLGSLIFAELLYRKQTYVATDKQE